MKKGIESQKSVQAQQEGLRGLLGLSPKAEASAVWFSQGAPQLLLLLGGVALRIEYHNETTVALQTVPRRWQPMRDPHVRCLLEDLNGQLPGVGVRISKDTFSIFTLVPSEPDALQATISLLVDFAADVYAFADYMVTSLTLIGDSDFALPAFAQYISHRDLGCEAAVDAVAAMADDDE